MGRTDVDRLIAELAVGKPTAIPSEMTFASKEDVELAMMAEELEGRKQDRKQRGTFSICIFIFVAIYMMVALVILALTGADVFELSDTVLVALLTTTTADVIGIFILVAKYLFHTN